MCAGTLAAFSTANAHHFNQERQVNEAKVMFITANDM